jgi:predicted transcriptional regulator
MSSKYQKQVLCEDGETLKALRENLPWSWTVTDIAEALHIRPSRAYAKIRLWFYVGLIAKLPQKTGGHQRFTFNK